MSFNCPACGRQRTLVINRSITLPPDSRSDDIILQTLRCSACRFRGAAVYEESRRGSLDAESWDHRGYSLDEADWEWLSKTMARCPNPKDKRCRCEAHKALGGRDASGRWLMPESFSWQRSFPMRRG